MEEIDEAQLWCAINFCGEVSPSLARVKKHFERMYNPSAVCSPNVDDLIFPQEVQDQVKRLKCGKDCGTDGIPPGIFLIVTACLDLNYNDVI